MTLRNELNSMSISQTTRIMGTIHDVADEIGDVTHHAVYEFFAREYDKAGGEEEQRAAELF